MQIFLHNLCEFLELIQPDSGRKQETENRKTKHLVKIAIFFVLSYYCA